MKCDKSVSVAEHQTQHLHNLSPFSLHSMMQVSAEAWHAILYLVTKTPWQYTQRLGVLFYDILSRLGSILRYSVTIRRGLACYSISCHALAVSTEAWHAILSLVTPWQYQPRLSRLGSIRPIPPRLGMLFYILA